MVIKKEDRLLSQLNTSKTVANDQALWQVIKQLIKRIQDLENIDSSNIVNTTVITGGIMGPPGMMGRDGKDGMIGPPGLQGIDGISNIPGPAGSITIGPMGMNGSNGLNGFPIPGPSGPTGAIGNTGPAGPITIGPMGINGLDKMISFFIPGPSGGGGGGGTTSGTEAALPISGTNGELYLPTDGVYIHRYNGTVWSQWGPIFPLVEPINADFSWVNQGTASIDVTNGGVFLSDLKGASVVNDLRIRKKAAPATPYTITAVFLVYPLSQNYFTFGLLFRASGAETLHTLRIVYDGGLLKIGSTKWNSPTSFGAEYVTLTNYITPNFVFIRIADNGVNRICSFSADGQHWEVFHTIGRTDFLTANEVGFFIDVANTTFGMNTLLLSWKEG